MNNREVEQAAADELELAILEETDGTVQLAGDQALRVVRNLRWRVDGKVRPLMAQD